MPKTNAPSPQDEQERYAASLSYIWILCLYPLLFKRKSAFIQFHAKQGLALFVIESVSFVFFFLMPIIIILCIIFSLIGIKASLEGKYWTMPLIGEWLKKTKI